MIPVRSATVLDWFQKVWQTQQHAQKNPSQSLRIVAIATLFFTGARVQEVCNLRQADVVVSPDGVVQFYIKGLKGGAVRVVPARSLFLVQTINTYRELWPAAARSPFIVTRTGVKPYPRLVHRIVKSAFPTASPHSFRHHYAALLASEGVHVTVIQYLLGHRWLNTTAIYLGQLATGPAAEIWMKVDNRLRQSDLLPHGQSDFLQTRTLKNKELTDE